MKILIATPAYGGMVTVPYISSMIDTVRHLHDNGINARNMFIENESLVTRARNNCVATFMSDPNCEALFFIDADIKWHPNDALDLVKALNPDAGRHVVTGSYPKKGINWENIANAVNLGVPPDQLKMFGDRAVINALPLAKGETRVVNLREPMEILAAGTGFMLIHRSVFERMREAYPDRRYKPDYKMGLPAFDDREDSMVDCFFDTEIVVDETNLERNAKGVKRYLSEDYSFCRLWRKIGGKIHVLPWINLGHHGTYLYQGNLSAGMKMAEVMERRKTEESLTDPKQNKQQIKTRII